MTAHVRSERIMTYESRPQCPAGADQLTGDFLGARTFPGEPAQVGAARLFVEDVAGDDIDRIDDLLLLTSELVTNAVQHAEGHITVFVWRRGLAIRVEVIDNGGPTEPEVKAAPQSAAEPLDDEGRGLYLVDCIADSWNTYADEAGRNTWFELMDPAPPHTPLRRIREEVRHDAAPA